MRWENLKETFINFRLTSQSRYGRTLQRRFPTRRFRTLYLRPIFLSAPGFGLTTGTSPRVKVLLSNIKQRSCWRMWRVVITQSPRSILTSSSLLRSAWRWWASFTITIILLNYFINQVEELDRSWDAFKRVLKQHKHLTSNGLVPVHAVRLVPTSSLEKCSWNLIFTWLSPIN